MKKKLLLNHLHRALEALYGENSNAWGPLGPARITESQSQEYSWEFDNSPYTSWLISQEWGFENNNNSFTTFIGGVGGGRRVTLIKTKKGLDRGVIDKILEDLYKKGIGNIVYRESPIPIPKSQAQLEELKNLPLKEVRKTLASWANNQLIINPTTNLPVIREWEWENKKFLGPVYRIKGLGEGDTVIPAPEPFIPEGPLGELIQRALLEAQGE